jgi:branched-subunit amino acid aminotransferase/4-amino-4-deoxychorismate lyase
MERAFLYGDLLFETILATPAGIPYISHHFRRLEKSAAILKMDLCGLNEEKFHQELTQVLNQFKVKNSNCSHFRIRFVLNRKSGGFYLPDSNQSSYFIEIFRFEPKPNEKVLRLGIYTEQQKAPGVLANLKTGNALVYVMASLWAKENKLDDALIVNTENQIIEASSSNIFWKQNGQWFTPPLSSGCVAGIGRELFLNQNKVTEKACYANDLFNAEDGILTNALTAPRRFKLIALN